MRNRSSYVQVTIIIVKSQSVWDVQSHNWHVKVLDFAPFRGSYVREFELSHGNLVLKQNYKNNACTQFALEDVGLWPFYNSYVKKTQIVYYKISQTILRTHLGFITTSAEIYFCSYHVTPLNKTVSNYCVN